MEREAAGCIRLKGVRQNNLKGFDMDLPLGRLVVVTGLSGSGKSSLVFETLHAEGQRRYVETFSPYARQFLEMLDRPAVEGIENIHPSIAIEQRNTVKTTRSTVGTITELCDFFKVWFCHEASLFDPESGEKVEDDNPQTIWKKAFLRWKGRELLMTFKLERPGNFEWGEIFSSLKGQGFSRIFFPGGTKKIERIEKIDAGGLETDEIYILQDRIRMETGNRNRFLDGARTALRFGTGRLHLFSRSGNRLAEFSEGLVSPSTGRRFKAPSPALFSFNSPAGACPECRGFGRIIEIDYRLVIPNSERSLEGGAIKAFQGAVYSESLRDLLKACRKRGIPTKVPYRDLTEEEKDFVISGEPGYGEEGREWPRAWYGAKRFFTWLEGNTYKMHVRVFLSKFRSYTTCPHCRGFRLQPEALNWKWRGRTLPELYRLPISKLLDRFEKRHRSSGNHQVEIAAESILARLHYLEEVGLGYLTLGRPSRTLSGGEMERVNLTACLGTSLVDTLFILDEPSIGLHSRDINRLIAILAKLTRHGNTVVVVEHDEAIMRAADLIIELGPGPGRQGGHLTFKGPLKDILDAPGSITGDYLKGRKTIALPEKRRPVSFPPGKGRKRPSREAFLKFQRASKHNIRDLSFGIPLNRFVCVSGVSGSGKSTLLDNVIYRGLLVESGKIVESPARIEKIEGEERIREVVLVNQSPVSRTPRSNPALYTDAWTSIREIFAATPEARSSGMGPSDFSFNSGNGRCPHCRGLGYERVEMQFMADVYVTCPVCEGRRFTPEVLALTYRKLSISDILDLTVREAALFFADYPKVRTRLERLEEVGLGYLPIGQPLNTLSGGEGQRLKLVKYLSGLGRQIEPALLLLDEPTTGLHRDDVKRLISVLQNLVEKGHTLVVIEHHLDVLKSADWIIEMGPGAGEAGGKIIFEGVPEDLIREKVPTAPFLKREIKLSGNGRRRAKESRGAVRQGRQRGPSGAVLSFPGNGRRRPALKAAEEAAGYERAAPGALQLTGAREHNLRNLSLSIPHREICVLTGISGSGKSSLAFDIIFAEGQRRFMESMSPYARQFVEQMPRPDIDRLSGIPPTIAIEQRVTHGTRKSTVATITEVAQYLRLLYARIGTQHSPVSGMPLIALKPSALRKRFHDVLEREKSKRVPFLYLCAPLVRGRKGHHQPLADWASDHHYRILRVDGLWVRIPAFKKLDRYREHDIEVVVGRASPADGTVNFEKGGSEGKRGGDPIREAQKLGKGSFFLAYPRKAKIAAWFSTTRTDPVTGESFPELDPKHFSWNSPKGWCPSCRGYGRIFEWMKARDEFPETVDSVADGETCHACEGSRLNRVSRSVYLHFRDGKKLSFSGLLELTSGELLARLQNLKLDRRGRKITESVIPEIEERLKFMSDVGLGYLTLDRSTATLSGGEAQRIRLAAQLGSNLSGVLYVLDEPSIGLHAKDNKRLLQSLKELRQKGNSLLVVEHDEDTMRVADRIIDLGPGAGLHGGEVIANGSLKEIKGNPSSLTGRYLKKGIKHPSRGAFRSLPSSWKPPRSSRRPPVRDWLVLKGAGLRNLKGGDLHLPLRKLIMVCGVSGAGKSTLIRDLLNPAVSHAAKNQINRLEGREFLKAGLISAEAGKKPAFRQLWNGDAFRRVIEVDQSPIGKTPRSTPATYIGAFDVIRRLFGVLPESRLLGFSASTFSFNTKGGRCEHCKGAGRIKLEMSFMPDIYVDCEECGGCRYGKELEAIRWKGKNIADVLALSFEEAAAFFSFHGRLKATLDLMVETGLGYLTLGQSSPSLSGGEAQRLKLVSELVKGLQSVKERSLGIVPRNLYILEEPTIGLHLSDCEKLIGLLHRLVDQGHTVIVIEHHLDLIAEADYVVEIGPEGGEGGGEILYQGPARGLADCPGSPTAPFMQGKIKSCCMDSKK